MHKLTVPESVASLTGFCLICGDVMSTGAAIDCLRRNARKGLAAAE